MPEKVVLPATVLASAGTPTAQYRRQHLICVFAEIREKDIRTAKILEERHKERVKILHF
jgi:hypothetical protein